MNWEDRVRSRKSYKQWSELMDLLRQKPGVSRILWRLYFLLDDKGAFGSQTKAGHAYESLHLFCRDNELDRRYCYGP